MRSCCGRLLVLAALAAPHLAWAQAGHVLSMTGTAMVERAGQPPRILGAGERIEPKDVINVAQASHVVLELRDKTRITLRPNTVFRVERYDDTGAQQGMVLGLVKGGFRANTGEIAKKNPQAVRFQTDTVILGIRGTEFDARLCDTDCAAEERAQPLRRVRSRPAGRVIELAGTVIATGVQGGTRTLVAGALIFEGETVAADSDARALLAFRDESRITLAGNAKLAVARFDYDGGTPGQGIAHMRLLSGDAHVWTGKLARLGPDAFLFETPRGMIRALGTGFSVSGGDVVVVHTWDGSVIIQTATERIELKKTDTAAIAVVDGRITLLPRPPATLLASALPRPDTVNVDASTFSGGAAADEGLYVWVREGAVTLGTGPETVEVQAGNAIHATGAGIRQLPVVPGFMRFDLTPLPGMPRPPAVLPFFRTADGSITNMCSAR